MSRIVGIGASAGGLESLEKLFSAMPADTGMSFVVIQHLSPDFRSLMDELIARHSDMPVVVAEDGLPVQPNHIYLLPPRKEMIIRNKTLILTDKPNGLSLPIDLFFRSLAQDVGAESVAVVLSGSGSDGSRGVIDVKRAGGLVMIETPATAKFDGMPMSSHATGVVDHSATPRDLARLLCGLPPLDPVDEMEGDQVLNEDPAMDSLLRQLRDGFGIDFSLYKITTVARRVQRRAELMRAQSLDQYAEHVRNDPSELNTLYQDLLIGVTQFFRDPESFDLLEREVIPQLLDKIPPEQEVRVWSAGCATGEEPYSLAMLFYEQMSARQRPLNLKILATDVHQLSLETASAGIYGEQQLANLSPQRRERFFIKRATGFQVSPELRSLIVFARHNVTKDAPFTKMNFISCRNMLIYFQPQAQRTVMSLFHFALAPNGVLFLGASESPGPLSDEFISVDEHWKIFRKRRDVALLSNVRLPTLGSPIRRQPFEPPRPHGPDPLILATYDQLLDRFMPPSLLVDEDRNLIDSFGGAEKLLHVRKRRPTSNVLDLIDGELKNVIGGAMQRAVKENGRVAFSGVRMLESDGGEKRCTVTAEPFVHPRTGARSILVAFLDVTPIEPFVEAEAPVAASTMQHDQASRDRMETLETELAYTRETLQATIEELETSNEEMQATNEELVASNEELQSTNEELHSVNEELYTVNAEYQQKIIELKELNADMQHLLEGTDVGTVFLDRELRIRRFTERIASVFRIQPDDVGRKIGDFSHHLVRPTLMQEIEKVRARGVTIEEEVRDRDGTPYFLRILPYRVTRAGDAPRKLESGADGVVLTLTDISTLAAARSRLAQLSAMVESSEDAIIGKALDGTIIYWNRGAEKLYGYTAAEAVGKHARMLLPPEKTDETDRFISTVRKGGKVEQVQTIHVRKDGTRLEISKTVSPVFNSEGDLVAVSSIARDISALVAAQRAAEDGQERVRALLESTAEAARRREQFLAMLSHELRNPLAAVLGATSVLAANPERATSERCCNVIERQARHMARLLDDLLDVSRITRGKFELRSAPLDLRAAIDGAIESTAPLFEQKGVTLDLALPDEPIPMTGDIARLQQVIVNLLSNAANYSARGNRVELRVMPQGDQVLLRVLDRGFGIEREMLSKIFELFVQAEQRIDRPRGGLGVGLSLAKSIVELHGGSIEARSDGPMMGSEFLVRLPLTKPAETRASKPHIQRGPRRRIVLVEDQNDAREMLRMLLESLDHEVLDASDGASGVELIEKVKPDFALIDIGLPTMTGYEVAQRIRQSADLQSIMLVALTGYGTANDVVAAHDAGFDAHLVKPADLVRLQQLLASHKKDDSFD
ncbi:MAG TPA: CheR family methyltransferase [Kofleriaceae bacterium]|nr:CheR family methyltransferase [Kofleriaceae bacterium]